MQKLVESRKTYLENKITELNEKYVFGTLSSMEKEHLKKQLTRYEKELMRLNNAIILNKPVKVVEEPNKGKLSLITKYNHRKG